MELADEINHLMGVKIAFAETSEKLCCPNVCCRDPIQNLTDRQERMECTSCAFRGRLDVVKKHGLKRFAYHATVELRTYVIDDELIPVAQNTETFLLQNRLNMIVYGKVVETISVAK